MKRHTTVRLAGAALALLLLSALAVTARADEVLRWNELATGLAAKTNTDPLTESRWFAMMHVAMHDAINAVDPRFEGASRLVVELQDLGHRRLLAT